MRLGFPLTALGSLAVVVGLLALLYERPRGTERVELLLYCSAGLQKPVERVIADYRAEYPHAEVRFIPGATSHLMPSVLEGDQGDLFLSVEEQEVNIAHDKGRLHERLPVAVVTPVIAVPKGNSHQITSLASLLKPGLKIGLGVPEKGPMIGRLSKRVLEKAQLWPQVEAAVRNRGVFKSTVNDLANDLKIGALDVAILYDGIMGAYPDLEAVPIPPAANFQERAVIGVLQTAKNPAAALHFARYLTAPDRGLGRFREQGFAVTDGDAWADRPRLKLMSGNILRPAIDDTIRAFELREGVQIDRNYNGCGTLITGIRAGDRPDAFFACEQSFLAAVQDHFLDGTTVSRTRLVIAVPRGNPANIRTLADLGRDGARIGLANPSTALGVISRRLLESQGLWEQAAKNRVVEQPTADFLVTFVQGNAKPTAQLDAVIVYEVNARRVAEQVEVIPIPAAETPVLQPFAVAKSSTHKLLTARLLAALRQSTSRERFEATGFEWSQEK